MGRPRVERVPIKCGACGTMFYERASRNRRYCSKTCGGLNTAKRYQGARHSFSCIQCGKVSSVSPHRAGRAKFCSRKCQTTFIARAFASVHGDARRGTGTKTKYVKRGGRHEHRAVAEAAIGRKLLPGEIVHHDDENTRNNAPGNLIVLPSQAEHARIHSTKNRKCAVPGCGAKHRAKGLCNKHYHESRRA